MIDLRHGRNAFGFFEVVDRPTPEELKEYYATVYFEKEKGSYRKECPFKESGAFTSKIAQLGLDSSNE